MTEVTGGGRIDVGNGNPTEFRDIEAKLRNQVAKWQSKLLDLGNRNPLINCSFSPSRGVVELVGPDTETIWRKLASEGAAGSNSMRFPWHRELVPPPPGFDGDAEDDQSKTGRQKKDWNPSLEECRNSPMLGERDLLTGLGDQALDRRLRTLDGHAHLSLSEQGVHCLYVAFGFLKWFESVDSDVEHYSPLMLVPMTLSRASADAPWELTEAEDDAIDNLCIRERFKQDFGMTLPALPDIDDLEEQGARERFLDAVRDRISTNDRWEVQDRCALGRFAFPKVAMWQDLGDHVESVLTNALCRSVGGDETIAPAHCFGLKGPLPEAAKFDDELAPGEIKTILDCDSSQLEAIIAARRGVSFVLDGPPGTGKSQTIANIIADALSEGRRVLFVSEKVSALEVVKRRLDECGLGDFCLECHSSKANRKTVLDELKYCLDLPVEVYDDVTPKLEEAKQKRSKLNDYVRSIHRRRPPLGLSPYELYGHVTRHHRLGLAVKSRCHLPSVEGLNRSRFDDWLQLLDRAKESADVIKQYGRHPWKGCQLTVRTLTLADDLNHHLGVLSASLGSVHLSLNPLVQQGLLPSEPNLTALNATVLALRESLEAPHVPAQWFDSPREISAAIVQWCDVKHEIEQYRARLPEFVADVEKQFPDDLLAELSLRPEQGIWLDRLEGHLPNSLRKQQLFLAEPLQQLQVLLNSIETTSRAAAHVIGLFPVPVRVDLPAQKLPVLAELARLVATVLPMRAEWLLSDTWPRLRAISQAAISNIEEATLIEKRLENRLTALQLIALDIAFNNSTQLQSAWNSLKPLLTVGSENELAILKSQVDNSIATLQDLRSNIHEAYQSIGIESAPSSSLKVASSFDAIGPLLLKMNYLPGNWREPSTRRKIRAACEEAINDVREASELRAQLEERLSHRAFKQTAAPLVNRVVEYQSFWKRLFGGFGSYRQEVAEFFKVSPPATPVLLADLWRLRTWHRRMSEIEETSKTVAPHLPESFNHEDFDAWNGIRETLDSFDRLEQEAADLTNRLPFRIIVINGNQLGTALPRIRSLTQQTLQIFKGSPLEAMLDNETEIDELYRQLITLRDAIACCQSAVAAATKCYSALPVNFSTIIDDISLANRYVNLQEDTKTHFRPLVDSCPPDTNPMDLGVWREILQQIHVAERLSKLVPSLDKYQDVLCREGSLDTSELSASASRLDAAYRDLIGAIQKIVPSLRLFPDRLSADELIKRTVTELATAAGGAFPTIATRHRILTSLLPLLVPEADVDLSAIPEVQSAVDGIRSGHAKLDRSTSILIELNVSLHHGLTDGGRPEAMWLFQKSNNEQLSPLVASVARSPLIRTQVTEIVEAIQRALDKDASTSMKFLRTVFCFQSETGHGITIPQMPLSMLGEFLSELRSEVGSLDEWLKYSRWRRDMAENGFDGVVEELLTNSYEPHETKNVVTARFFRLLFDHFATDDRLLGEFDMEAHEQSRERFRKLDEWETRAASSRIRQYQLGRDDRPRAGWFAESTSELGILQREIQKKRRQLPLRKLFSEVPSILQRLKPCVMMSPLSVSTFLQSDELRFDLVIFDEASQVFPWDAIGSIYRGTQLIVAGDEKQLPPTNFFNRADIESGDEEDNDIGDYESILSLCKSIGMPGRSLRWHYRSRREPLIAFSNRHFYNGDLVTFPSIRDAKGDAVRLEFVPQGRWIERANIREAERVTDIIIQHLRTRPETSLGIIAFNQSQQSAIEDSIYERRRKYPEVDALFNTGLSEPMFVKNLENVQGDERDIIVLSMGYGFNEAGKFLKNFGPLTKSGGERRLNVAVTRAREEVILVASVRAADLDVSASNSQGAHLLKCYLEYAERGVDSLAREIDSITGEAESPFEQEVATALIQRGLHPTAQVGCGGFRIDLALKHPQRPGEFCLGIECDGATYHSSKTARDRDRIRQSVLEHLGWNIIRVWSTDWIRNPDRQIERILSAYERVSTAIAKDSTHNESLVESELDDPVPRIAVKLTASSPVFKAIKDVPENHLRSTFRSIVKRGGAIDLEGLIQQTVRELGFGRTGKQIRQRLEASLNDLLQVGQLRWAGDRITSGTE